MESGTKAKGEANPPLAATAPVEPPPTGPPAITARDLEKTFRTPLDGPTTLKERALNPFRRSKISELQALGGVSLEVAQGEFFGIVGANGSGKSTLLKLLAGIYHPDRGTVDVRGRMSPFIELGVGFNPELPAWDNVAINCSLLGLSLNEARRRFDAIIEFAELGRFVDMKLKNYSSGMQVRLAFSTAIQVDADVILLDEVLAVGDAAFAQRCYDVFRRLRHQGRTVVLVTHNLSAVERFCDRAMLLDGGRPLLTGAPEEVISLYRQRASSAAAPGGETTWDGDRFGDGRAELTGAWFENGAGERIDACEQGERLAFIAEVTFNEAMQEPALGIQLTDEHGTVVFATNNHWSGPAKPDFSAGERVRFRVELDNVFAIGRLYANPGVADRDLVALAEYRPSMTTVLITGPRWTTGAVDLPHELSLERLSA